ncbi:MAG: sulfite exporter TauE/SafE family protein [Lewinellaceae bacterium]|nr:sulfite exporter TauE/SafE family protein [Lewinellaceae bacterium]
MTDWLQMMAESQDLPWLSALALGLLTAISPCPLATNITATAYLSKEMGSKKAVLWRGFLYTLGRGASYTTIGVALYWGASLFHVARFFQSKGELLLAPLLILTGLIMLGIIRLGFLGQGNFVERFSEKLKNKGALGALVMGMLFALAFCPYSGALYFGMLIPMTVASPSGLFLPLLFALGTGVPVMIFAYLLAFSASKVGTAFNAIRKVEVGMRYAAGIVFVLAGIYYSLIFLHWI